LPELKFRILQNFLRYDEGLGKAHKIQKNFGAVQDLRALCRIKNNVGKFVFGEIHNRIFDINL
jgi:hypothetical protein